MAKQVMTAKEVGEALDVSDSTAYKIIRELNAELKSRGFITVPGKVSRVYFQEKMYGGKEMAAGD